MAKKYKLTVIYGTEACREYDEHSLNTVKRKICRGDIDGDVKSYVFDTMHDVNIACQMLLDDDGWMTNSWELEELGK